MKNHTIKDLAVNPNYLARKAAARIVSTLTKQLAFQIADDHETMQKLVELETLEASVRDLQDSIARHWQDKLGI